MVSIDGTEHSDSLIRVRNLNKVYTRGNEKINVLQGLTLDVEKGEFVAFMGPSGSGKTTLLSLVGCMSRPTSGTVTVGGRNVSSLPEHFLTEERRKTFGFIFQSLNLLGDLNVLDNIALPLYPGESGIADMKRRAAAAAAEMKLSHRLSIPASRLSGGEQQRVAIARALVTGPEVIIADEPTAHLDSTLTEELLAILFSLNREGRTIVISTHDPAVHDRGEVTRRVFMRDGTLEDGAS